MRFDSAGIVEELVWNMRLAELVRASNRDILNQLYNGDPPFDPRLAEENNIEINQNDLSGVNLLSHARTQWNTAFLNQENYFSVTVDAKPKHKCGEWGRIITRVSQRELKQARDQLEEKRATGGQTVLHGIGPTTWDTRRSVIATPIPIPSLLIPSETDIDFKNLPYFAIFREWTADQLRLMTTGPRVDPGWNMDLVNSQIRYIANQVQKETSATAWQYMPERITELEKQDLGWWGSDAAPTIDVWDFYFKDPDNSNGWYRRMILDWGVNEVARDKKGKPDRENKDANGTFLYSSGRRKFADSHNEIIHCQFGDCSAVFPQKYHSVRSLGWMLWGVCDLQNRLHSKFNEAVFSSLLEFFRTASDADLKRLKKANFTQYGVVPAGIDWVKGGDRYAPNWPLVQGAFARNRSQMEESAAPYIHQFDTAGGKEMREIEVLAKLNQVNALASGMISLAYNYEEFKYAEQCRRICIKVKPDPIAARIRLGCLKEGVPEEIFDSERWRARADRVLGAGNKTLAMNQIQLLQGIRPHLNPDAQRQVDHQSIEVWTEDPSMAEQLAPIDNQKQITSSMHDAQLSTERLMRGLPLAPRPDMVYEDYVMVWLADLELMTNTAQAKGGMATPEQVLGWQTMGKQIGQFLDVMAKDDEEKPKVKMYADRLIAVGKLVKGFEQRLMEQAKAAAKQNGNGGIDPEKVVKARFELAKDDKKLQNMERSHGMRTAQKQVSFELKEQQQDRATNAEIARENAKARHEIIRKGLTSLSESSDENNPTH